MVRLQIYKTIFFRIMYIPQGFQAKQLEGRGLEPAHKAEVEISCLPHSFFLTIIYLMKLIVLNGLRFQGRFSLQVKGLKKLPVHLGNKGDLDAFRAGSLALVVI